MKQCVVLMMAFLCVHGAPVDVLPTGSCLDPVAINAATEALNQINLDRTEGYIFRLDHLSNVHQMVHGETGIVFHLKFYVLETNCHVLSKKIWSNCEIRNPAEYPAYGQCKAVMYMNREHGVVRLYKYRCTVRPVPASKIRERCPDCPVQLPQNHKEALKIVKMGMERYNNESALANYFVPLNITRFSVQFGFGRFYNVEFTIQETVCSSKTAIANISKCEVMACEFGHKGFCTASHSISVFAGEHFRVQCKIFEPEAAEEQNKKHLIGGELDHSHCNTTASSSGHEHDSTKAHDHEHSEGHGHTHSDDHDHVHTNHSKAHEHAPDEWEHHHHQYTHKTEETHEHNHELVLDHEHKHRHLHEHEHHHHGHALQTPVRRPDGMVNVLPPMDKPMTLPSFPDEPSAGPEPASTLPDPQIPGQREPTILPFPSTLSPDCPAPFYTANGVLLQIISEDPLFKTVA